MKEVKAVIGANFGDEGKGLMTDYFCSRFPETDRVLNVRFNGGAQAGHTVVTPDGRRHVFSHFGSGSFLPNVATYLSNEFIVNPILFRKEYEELRRLGVYPMVYVHPCCLITQPQDMMLNQFLETARGNMRHGSCGVGIYETQLRQKYHRQLNANQLEETRGINLDLDYYSSERFEKMIGIPLTESMKKLMCNQNIMAHYQDDVRFMLDHVNIADRSILGTFDYVVFEGAQGLMLDQNNMEYFPHLTPSNTGIANIAPYIREANPDSVEICYVTRPYLTRHGAGKLPGETTREAVGAKIDLTNHPNDFQGSLRYGVLDTQAMIRRCREDMKKLNTAAIMSFAITHMDEVSNGFEPNPVFQAYRRYCSTGPTRRDVH